jgi:hypothetical protein
VRLTCPLLFRVDLRDGTPEAEFSRTGPPRLATRADRFLSAVAPKPTRRSVALTPGCAVSTGKSRRGRGGLFGLGGFASLCCCARKRCALVATGIGYRTPELSPRWFHQSPDAPPGAEEYERGQLYSRPWASCTDAATSS